MMQPQIMPQMPSLVIGLIALILGAYPILQFFNVIPLKFVLPSLILPIVLVIGGMLLVLDYILGFSLA